MILESKLPFRFEMCYTLIIHANKQAILEEK